jgi:V8-like Glu-specific endopeptidase
MMLKQPRYLLIGFVLPSLSLAACAASTATTIAPNLRRSATNGDAPGKIGGQENSSGNTGSLPGQVAPAQYPFPVDSTSRLTGLPLPFDGKEWAIANPALGEAILQFGKASGQYLAACEGKTKRAIAIEGALVVKSVQFFTTTNCVGAAAQFDYYFRGDNLNKISNNFNLSARYLDIFSTPLTITQANADNSNAYCGKTNWVAKQGQSIAGKFCDGNSFPNPNEQTNLSLQISADSIIESGRTYSKISSPAALGITGGSVIDVSTSNLAHATVAFMQKDNSFCTGTLISESHFVTAAHCYDAAIKMNQADLYVGFGSTASTQLKIIGMKKHEEYIVQDFPNKGSGFALAANNDIALVKFSGTLPKPFRPIAILPENEPFVANEKVYIAGFGLDENRNGGTLKSSFSLFSADSAVSKNFKTVSTVTQSTCNGDSGGPAFVLRGQFYYLVGATSYGPSDFTCMTGDSFFVDLRKFRTWLNNNAN